MKNRVGMFGIAVALAVAAIGGTNKWPFIIIRFAGGLNDAPQTFATLMESHRKYRGACDEFWFAGGGRKTPEGVLAVAEKIAKYRPLCDEAGIRLSY